MIAKFEKTVFKDTLHTSVCAYKNLHNLPHWHTAHEFVYVSAGQVELTVNNKKYVLMPDSCAFIRGEEIHLLQGTQDSIVHVIKTDAASVGLITEQKALCSPILKETYRFNQVIAELRQELEHPREYSGVISDSIVTRLTAEIFRSEETCITSNTSAPDEAQKRLLSWISKNYTHITFEDAVSYMNFSESYFSKYFQKISGMTFTRYLNTLKVSAASEKIAAGNSNMTEISISCGFGTIRNFNRVFKSLTGYTPRDLPKDFIFVHEFKNTDDIVFDPTLNSTEILG